MAEGQSSILIVDDDAEDLASVERALRSLGSELHSVKDPHEVIPSVHRHKPDVVILDALLPGLSGFDLCKQIKSDPQLKATQVLILTGVYLRQQYRHEAIQQFKADAFLTKPFRPPELQRLVVHLLARKTRMPQSSFLKRIGLPASSEPKKRGLFGRLFGRGEVEEPIRIAPVARDIAPPSPPSEPVAEAEKPRAESAPAVALEPPQETAPPAAEPRLAPAPEPPKVEAEEVKLEANPESPVAEPAPEAAAALEPQAPVEQPQPSPAAEAAPEPEVTSEPVVTAPAAVESTEPAVQEAAVGAPVETPASEEPPEATPAKAAETEEPPPTAALDAPSEAEEVTWIQADSRTQEMTLEEAAARVAEGASERTAPLEPKASPAEPEPQTEMHEGILPPADSLQPLKRPLFRVGEVPIYDESDFLSELKRELSKCKRVDRPLTLILIRVGDLHQIIELFGKDFREPVLWHIAEQAMESLREVDLVGMMSSKDLIAMTAFASDRYGGGRIVSRMRQAVTRKPFRVGEELPPIIPALDFGMATFPADGAEVSNLMRRAEEDLTNGGGSAAVSD